MAEIKPIGIDQTTGQARSVASSDNLVNDIGDVIELAVTQVGDYSGGVNNAQLIFPWSNPQRLADPASLPDGAGNDIAWSPDNEFLAVAYEGAVPGGTYFSVYQRTGITLNKVVTPSLPGPARGVDWSYSGEFLSFANGDFSSVIFVTTYQRSGSVFTKLSNPAALPPNSPYSAAWSPNGEFLVIAHQNSPNVLIYQRSETTFTKLADPATVPPGVGRNAAWSPNNEFLVIAHHTSPYITIYQRNGTTFTKLADPSTLPTGNGLGAAWSPNGEFLAISYDATPFITIYQRSGTAFNKIADPSSLPGSTANGVAWSPNGKYLAVAESNSPYIVVYFKDGNTFTRQANPATLPTGSGNRAAWSTNGEFLSVAHSTTPYITTYQTSSSMPAGGIVTTIGLTLT